MNLLARLNSIAARIGIAIVLAIVLGVSMAIGLAEGLNHYGFRLGSEPRGPARVLISGSGVLVIRPYMHPMMLSGKIAMIIRAAASSPLPERQKVIAAIAYPEMQVAFDAPALPEIASSIDDNLDRLSKLIQMQLEQL